METLIENHISRGENKDRVLKHYNVVRKFETVELADKGAVKLTGPTDVDLSKCEVVLYIQHRRNLSVLGASRIDLKSE